MKRSLLTIIWSITVLLKASAQWKGGIEQYNYINARTAGNFVPVLHIQSSKNWYAEMRYNYDNDQTGSLYVGKELSGGNRWNYSITPMIGASIGNFKSIAVANKTELENKKFFVSIEAQYNQALNNDQSSFFFTWSEVSFNFSKWFFSGAAVQYTLQQGAEDFEPGIIAGISFKNISIPVYVFSPFRSNTYLVIGLNYEYNLKTKK
jgi:hypothetical protein